MNFDLQTLWQEFSATVIRYAPNVVAALLIFLIGRIVANLVDSGVRKALIRANCEPALIGFLAAIARTGVLVFVIIAALGQAGVPTNGAVAIFGAAGLAVGFAMQGTLSNFAAGVMIMIFRPFKIGDFVSAGGSTGKITAVDIFTTTFTSPDNQKIIVPNGQIMGDTITNVTANDTRRVDLTASIGYGDNIAQAKEVLERIVREHELILQDPAPVIELAELGDSSVNFVVRPWTRTSDYWRVYWDLTRSIKEEFDKAGISIPFPQQDVHMHQVN